MWSIIYKIFSVSFWKLLGLIVYISLMTTSVWFTWGVFEKFAKKETAMHLYEEKIEAHPTIAICNFNPYLWKHGLKGLERVGPAWEYQKNFTLIYATYQSDGLSIEDEVILKIGENYLENSRENVTLTVIYTEYNTICYAINSDGKVDERQTEIKIWSPVNTFSYKDVFFTSKKNSYGVTRRDWRDGEVYSFSLSSGIQKNVTLTVKENINLNCREESFYEYVLSKLSEDSFEVCNDTCLMTSLPNDPYPICPNYDEWYQEKYIEDYCNWSIVRNLIQNITSNDEHLKTCVTTQYSGISQEGICSNKEAKVKYKFSLPLKVKVSKEYFIIDTIGLIGSVGGTLGVFIGFSFSNMIICSIEYIQLLIENLGMSLTFKRKITHIIWKCLKWIIYFSLMATAILFASEIIEKYVGQNTGIKQNVEMIKSHPTITICPFLEQCERQQLEILGKIIVKIKGAAKDVWHNLEGTYILGTNLVNGKAHWIQEEGSNALWHYKKYNRFWIIGKIENLGRPTASIYSPDDSLGPLEATSWKYLDNSKWIESSDIAILRGPSSLCFEDSPNYGTKFNITYQTFKSNGLIANEKILLKIGENHISYDKEKVGLTKIYTRWNGICYKINSTRKADFGETEIKLKTSVSKTVGKTKFFFTSEENSFGVTNNNFNDGKIFSTQLSGGKWKKIYLSVEKNINLKCNKESFFEYVSSRLSESNFENCTHTCLRTSLPYEPYQICPAYGDWYANVLKGNLTEPEDDCNWGIVRDFIQDIITDGEHRKTCITIDYSGKIMSEQSDQESKFNELGIQYKFDFPMRAKVYEEFLITDTIELVGSVGGTLGMFVGFSFSNFITFIIGCIKDFLANRKKLSEDIWVAVGLILYISLLLTSIWFSWGVIDKYLKQDTGIQQHEGKIETHPKIVICMGSSKYQTDFQFNYGKNGYKMEYLKIGENYMENINETVTLIKVYTRYNGLCYAINTTQKVDESLIVIKIIPSDMLYKINIPRIIPVIFTSEMNSYGITQRDWRDGEEFSFTTSARNSKQIDLTVEKNINLKCSNQSFYAYVSSRLSEESFRTCNETCLMTSLPTNHYPICPNYNEWFHNDTKGKESNCNWYILRELVQNITMNKDHLKTCDTTQYLGKIILDVDREVDYAKIVYKLTLPLKAKVFREYLITDGITLIGSLGGTLSLFIGFSISNAIHFIVNDFFKSTMETHFSRNLKWLKGYFDQSKSFFKHKSNNV